MGSVLQRGAEEYANIRERESGRRRDSRRRWPLLNWSARLLINTWVSNGSSMTRAKVRRALVHIHTLNKSGNRFISVYITTRRRRFRNLERRRRPAKKNISPPPPPRAVEARFIVIGQGPPLHTERRAPSDVTAPGAPLRGVKFCSGLGRVAATERVHLNFCNGRARPPCGRF